MEYGQYAHHRKESLEIKRILVGVAGGSASGKTTICQNIKKEMTFNGEIDVLIISLDSFYKPLSHDVDAANYDFDSPNALDFDLAFEILQNLLDGKPTHIPRYNFVTHSREKETDLVNPTDIILFEGILALYDQKIRDLMAYMVYMHTDDDIRLCRRLLRDNAERARSVESILVQYNRFVKPSYDLYIKPTMNYADIIVPGRDKNHVSVQFIVDYLKSKATQLGLLRKVVKRDLVLIGDLVDETEFQSKEDMRSYKKVFLTPTHEDDKKHINSNFYNLKEGIFTKKVCNSSFKQFTRTAMSLWHKLSIVENYNLNDVSVVNLKTVIKNIDKVDTYKCSKSFILLCIPTLTQEDENLNKIIRSFATHSPKSVIIFISLFANLKTLKKYNNENKNIQKLINIFLIGNKQKFDAMIFENAKDETYRNKFYNLDFLGSKIYKAMVKSLEKYQVNQKGYDSDMSSDSN